MNRKELDKKRLDPCMTDIYAHAECVESQVWPQSYDTWKQHGIWGYQSKYKSDQNKPVTIAPMECYYLGHDDFKKIVDKWCKGLRGWWYYIPKLNHDDPEYETHIKEMDDFRKFEDEVSNDKSLTYAQRAAKIKKEALAHNFMWRSSDKEYINYNIYLGPSPTSSKETFEINSVIYTLIKELFETELKSNYIDYTKLTEFPYKGHESGEILQARVESTSYWYMDGKLHSRELNNYPVCNLYNDKGKYVDNLWNYDHLLRYLTANSFEQDIDLSVARAVELFKQRYPELYVSIKDNLDRYIGIDSYNYRQCLALYKMHKSYMASNS